MRDGNSGNILRFLGKYGVVSLPMRDGNKDKYNEVAEAKKVVSLPMRDGNIFFLGACGGPCQLLAYL